MINNFSLLIQHEATIVEWLENVSALFNANSLAHQPTEDLQWPLETSQPPVNGVMQTEIHFNNRVDCEQMSDFLNTQNLKHKKKFNKIAPWQEYHQEFMKPIQVGKLSIEPTSPPSLLRPQTLYFPAGLGFGTGHHETTRGCLSLMQEISLDETTILDFGSGSGILAVAAGLLGSHNIYYHDIDQQALDATASNLTAHHLNSKVKIYDPKQSSIQHDVVFANILCAPLIENRDLFFNLLKDHGTLITSGVIEEQSEHFAKHFSQKFTLSKHLKINEWHSYLWIKS